MTLFETTLPLRRGLAALRRRVRALVLVLGLSRAAVFLVTTLLLLFVADYFLRLPLGVRRILWLGVALGLVAILVRRLLRPLVSRLDDGLLAARVEAAHPALQDRLSSSLAFARAADDPDNEDSPELMRHVVEETVGMAGGIAFRRVARGRPALRWGLGAVALLLLAGGAALARPALAGIFLERAVLLRDVSWPRRTTLEVVDMVPGVARRVTLGRETAIQVRAQGSVPDRVELTYWERGSDSRRVERIDLAPSADDPGLFPVSLPVFASYEFTVTGGDDDRAETYVIEALTPPAVLKILMECEFPPYLERGPETLDGGDQRVPEGTKVRLLARTNMPLERAAILVGSEPPRDLERVEETLFATSLDARADVRYSLRLLGTNGEENDPGVDSFVLRVVKDNAPIVRIDAPALRSERLAGGVVLVRFTARDDHRVAGARLRYRVGEGNERVVALGESGGDALRLLQPEDAGEPDLLVGLGALDLARLRRDDGGPVAVGDTVSYQVEAHDSSGKSHLTRTPFRVEVIGEEDLNHGIDALQQELHETLERAKDRAQAAALDGASLPQDEPLQFRRGTLRAQALQARLIDSLDSLSRQIQSLLNLYVFNRLDDPSAVDQMLPYYERHLLSGASRAETPFTGTLYRVLFTAREEKAIRAGGALAKLIEMADVADRIAADHAPAAYRALGAAGRPEADADGTIGALEEARREEKAVNDGLARLASLMREWQSYEGVVRGLKGLRDTERGLVEQLNDLKKKD